MTRPSPYFAGAYMTIARCKQNLLAALDDQTNRVIALSGKWGTGKTHLWQQIRVESPHLSIKNAASVSLFGVSTINDLKMKIAQALLPRLDSDKALTASVTTALVGLKKLAKSFHSGFGALDELALLALPTLLKDKFIVIDDIERKHEKLSIDEILGFIDECVQSSKSRILLVLNDDKLIDRKVWDLFREKVIDQELRLDTSAAEAFEIAQGLVPTMWPAELQAATTACHLTNIRILCKVIRVTNRLLEGNGELSAEVIKRVVPTIALLSTIHYNGLVNGPTFDYILSYDGAMFATVRAIRKQQANYEETDEDTLHEEWDALIRRLGISQIGEFETVVVGVLQTGLIDTGAIRQLIERYQQDGRILATRNHVSSFFTCLNWHPEVSDGELTLKLRNLIPVAHFIEPPTVSYLIEIADDLTGNQTLGQQFIDAWTAALDAAYPDGLEYSGSELHRPIHPKIGAALDAAYARHSSAVTYAQACQQIRFERAWGSSEEHLLKTISEAEIEVAIRSATGADLENIFLQSLKFTVQRQSYENSFGDIGERFVNVCKKIVAAEPKGRFASIINRYFKARGQQALLEP
ncbi:hypothetical protein ALQ99_05372 [Pseudomonas syringae pv. lapsa]|nr:Uncharacterized protein ALO39_05543 [Pseudomonas syringae pv. lapsa]RML18950.1 hypothetical protein ALQ99_05372 [Pseudomonas syringae pv. lapsa]